MSEIQSAFDCG